MDQVEIATDAVRAELNKVLNKPGRRANAAKIRLALTNLAENVSNYRKSHMAIDWQQVRCERAGAPKDLTDVDGAFVHGHKNAMQEAINLFPTALNDLVRLKEESDKLALLIDILNAWDEFDPEEDTPRPPNINIWRTRWDSSREKRSVMPNKVYRDESGWMVQCWDRERAEEFTIPVSEVEL